MLQRDYTSAAVANFRLGGEAQEDSRPKRYHGSDRCGIGIIFMTQLTGIEYSVHPLKLRDGSALQIDL